jgi:hypothetical protein
MSALALALSLAMIAAAPSASSSMSLPAIGGIAPPVGTTLVNMDITPDGPGLPKADVYEIASTSTLSAFRDAYAAAARRAGYDTTITARRIAGVRRDGARFRLLLEPDGVNGDHVSGVLTITRPGKKTT